MSRGYGKYRRGGGPHACFQFENLFKENSNKPSAARSAASVGKWGVTSFTSIRTVNGVSRLEHGKSAPAETDVPRPKKFFKSRDPPESNTSLYTENAVEPSYGSNKKSKGGANGSATKAKTNVASKKFFSTRNSSPEKTVLSSNERADVKPPIVLRIYKGKSQLVNDSDESESTPTPASAPSTSTSPRSLRDAAAKSPGHGRITRSSRRSMQQDPSSSPATADTPAEFSFFTSPRQDCDLSPQYIPAEKYEMERKAMYDNLLRPNSPSKEDDDNEPLKMEEDSAENDDLDASRESPATSVKQEELSSPHEPMEASDVKEEDDMKKSSDDCNEHLSDTAMDFSATTTKQVEEPVKTAKIEEDWTSDSDSNSTVHEPDEQKQQVEVKENYSIEDIKAELEAEAINAPKEAAPPVKLVISKKKGSIFKSRAMAPGENRKRHALYKHKWCDEKDPAQKGSESSEHAKTLASSSVYDDFGFMDNPLVRITKNKSSQDDDDEAVTGVKCTRTDKGYYTVVRNVKKAHQIQEIGEFQEFNDDVDYILDALQDNNPISTRCLSAITLATKCMVPAFRMHLRAHGTVGKFFKALHDATRDQSLGLCTATVMFVLSQDRLNMDLDRDCLELMLNLLESDVSYQQALDVCGLSTGQLEKNKQKVRELCAEIQSQGHAMHLNLENITVGQLAMETLLSLTSKRAGEWFKEELRELGGLEHIMKTICDCSHQVPDYVVSWTDVLLDKLRKVDRCMRVLENVTHNNEENQTYLLKHNGGMILDTLVKLYRLCDAEIPLYPCIDITDKESKGTVIREALLVTLKVLINLTHHFSKKSMGSDLIGSRPGIIDASLHLLLQVPHYIPDQKKFELGVLVLMLLINLIQDNDENKKLLINAKAPADFESRLPCDKSAVEALIVQFYQWEECARLAEKRTNAILDGEKDTENEKVQYKSNEEFIEETVAKLLQKAGTHMEFTFLASYTVMLLGFLIMDNEEYLDVVRRFLKDHCFAEMVDILKKFFNFMSLTASTEASSVCAIKATEKVIKFLEDCDKTEQKEKVSGEPTTSECMDLSFSVTHKLS